MHISKFSTTAIGFILLPITLAQSPVLTVSPLGGPGTILVKVNGEIGSTGCLNDEGKWTVQDDACASFFGNGQGGLLSDQGWMILDDDSNIATTTSTWTTAWVGTHVDTSKDATWLQAQVGNTGTDPWGGPLWFTSAKPDSSTNVTLNGHAITDDVQVLLVFNSTFEDNSAVRYADFELR
ncbi:hypothetical protein NHQ30_001340 [Ciborinia camelliae]|nr:hypothetical protein NHQ30_001340 [Ciborinia camelliae]